MPTWSPSISTRLLEKDYLAFCREMGERGMSVSELLRERALATVSPGDLANLRVVRAALEENGECVLADGVDMCIASIDAILARLEARRMP